jgi:hypothetical protein
MKLKGLFSTAIAVLSGMIVIVGLFLPIYPINALSAIFLQWASILAGVAILLGIISLFGTHLSKIRQRSRSSTYSIALLLFFLLTFFLSALPQSLPLESILLNDIMVPIEISLMALLSVTLVYASARLLTRRADLKSIIFIVTILFTLIGLTPWPFIGSLPILGDIAQVLAAGGARGMLIGIALGTLLTGMRILFGADRPYGGK